MTATAVQVAEQTGVSEKEWVRLFPKEMTENYTSSITFMKQLTVVAVSTITYLKNAFPEESYSSETFGGLKLKLLKDKCQDELAQFMSTSMNQAFDAFDKRYVHQLALCFYHGDCSADKLIEYHVFEYAYSPEGVSLTLNSTARGRARRALRCSAAAVKSRTAMLVRSLSLFVWQHCSQELPVDYDVSLRLYYTEDSPEDYQAPGFGPSSGPDHLEATAGDTRCMGWVETPFHKLIARSFVRDLSSDSEEALPSDNNPEMTQDSEEFEGRCGGSAASGRSRAGAGAASGRSSPGAGAGADPEPALRCPCATTDTNELLVTCQYCHTRQHAACFGLLAPAAAHCCAGCARAPGRRPSCALLVGLDARKQECLCIFRRTMMLCSRQSTVSGEELVARFGLTATSASKILRLLQSHFVLPHADAQDLALPRKINPIRLKLAFKHFFRVKEQEDTMVDRLMAETERDASDPVGDVLSPLEKVALHNSSNLGTVVESSAAPPSVPDPTLQQYRAVLAPDEATDELPLSGDHNPVAVGRLGRRLKRQKDGEDEDWRPSKLPKLRSGAKTKKKV